MTEKEARISWAMATLNKSGSAEIHAAVSACSLNGMPTMKKQGPGQKTMSAPTAADIYARCREFGSSHEIANATAYILRATMREKQDGCFVEYWSRTTDEILEDFRKLGKYRRDFKDKAWTSAYGGLRLLGRERQPTEADYLRMALVKDGTDISRICDFTSSVLGKDASSFKKPEYAAKAVLAQLKRLAMAGWYLNGDLPMDGYCKDYLLHALGRAKAIYHYDDREFVGRRVMNGIALCQEIVETGIVNESRLNAAASALSEIENLQKIHGNNFALIVALLDDTDFCMLKMMAKAARDLGVVQTPVCGKEEEDVSDLPLFNQVEETTKTQVVETPAVRTVSGASVWNNA
jgi:hypothetical protein